MSSFVQRVPWHLIVLGVALCATVYVYFTVRELHRIDLKVDALCGQMSRLHHTTELKLKEVDTHIANNMTGRQELSQQQQQQQQLMFDSLIPALFAAKQIVVDEDEEYDEDDYYDDDADGALIKNMLMAQIDEIDEIEGDEIEGDEIEGDEIQGDEIQGDEIQSVETEMEEEKIEGDMKIEEETAKGDMVGEKIGGDRKLLARSVEDLKAMKVDDLRRELREQGMDWRGNKESLVERLVSL